MMRLVPWGQLFPPRAHDWYIDLRWRRSHVACQPLDAQNCTHTGTHSAHDPTTPHQPKLANPPNPTGNLLRFGDTRGYNSLARMYTLDYAR